MSPKTVLPAAVLAAFAILALSIGCSKNSDPKNPIHDTITVTKTDTLTDTLYATKPDPTVNLTKGLLLYLPFSGNIADSSGNSNPTQAVGNVLTYDAHGYANNAFGATGNTERIYVTNNGSIQFDTAFSLSFGVMVNTVRAQTYICMIDTARGVGASFLIGNTLYPATSSLIFGSEDVSLGCSNIGTNDNYDIADTTGFIPVPGSWYNVVAIYHRGTNQVYINGVLVSTKVGLGTKANWCPASKIVIGNWYSGDYGQAMNGKLDNIRLYNRVLTPHEIAKLSSNYQVTSNGYKPPVQTN